MAYVQARAMLASAVVCACALAYYAFSQRSCFGATFSGPGHGGCVSDIYGLYGLRHLATHAVPYLHVGKYGFPQGTVEYPVLTGFFAWACALIGAGPAAFMVVSCAVLALLTIGTAAALGRAFGVRALLFAASPALLVHAFQNWDLLPVAASAAGLLAWRRDRTATAAAAFAVGGSLKIYPALFLLPLLAATWQRGDHRRWRQELGVAVGVTLVANLPSVLLNAHGWAQVFSFQADRPLDPTAVSLWAIPFAFTPIELVNVLSLLALAAGATTVLAAATRRYVLTGHYPMLQSCAALTVVYMLTGKADSPQYMLWLLPFFVVLRVPVLWWALCGIGDVVCSHLVYNGLSAAGGMLGRPITASPQLVVEVLVHAALLVVLTVVFWHSSPAGFAPRARHLPGPDGMYGPDPLTGADLLTSPGLALPAVSPTSDAGSPRDEDAPVRASSV